MPSERKKVKKVRDCENCFFYDDYTLTCCCHEECDDLSLDISECDDLIDAAEAAFDEYLAECIADYSDLCSVRAQSRK